MNTHPEQWVANAAAPGEQLGVQCLAQGHLSRGIEGGESAGYSLPPPTIPAGPEIRTRPSGYKSDSLTIRPRLPLLNNKFNKLYKHTLTLNKLKYSMFNILNKHTQA